ncbi:MAG: hypothetical protein JRH20_30440 [Deltaproteobacteria bacterium]|nr:hypothetical protein [Deltaproteobacteria bacterium]
MQKLAAHCEPCNVVFGFSEQLGAESAPTAEPARPAPRAIAALPEAITVERVTAESHDDGPYRGSSGQHTERLIIRRRWFLPTHIVLMLFSFLWCGFLVVWYMKAGSHGHTPWYIYAFPVAHIAVGVSLMYSSLAGFLNTTEIVVTTDALSIGHAPLPWRGNKRLAVATIRQIYCSKHEASGRQGATTTTFRVHALLTNGKKARLLSGLPELDQALYIEAQIEDHLGIVNEPVAGEVST